MLETLTSYEISRRKQTMTAIIWTALIVAATLGIFDLQFNTWKSVIALFGLALICIPALLLNAKGRLIPSAVLLSSIVLLVISINLYDGDGVHDPGILAYPIFIMVGTLLFGKRALPLFLLAAVASLATIVFLEVNRFIRPEIGPTRFSILIPMVVLLLAASVIIWVIVENIERNLQRAKASEAELRKNYDLTLEAWAKVMEYRDRETEGHSRRLVELSTRLARALGCDEEQIIQLRRGALLHDIGKLAIPDDILLKPDTLNENEKIIVQKHPVYAKQMLADIPFLKPAVSVAYYHHEWWNGQGYPEGIKGQEIPLLARIFAVVDTWDALRSERVYRPAWSREKVVAYIREGAGIQFDPHIVEVFLKTV